MVGPSVSWSSSQVPGGNRGFSLIVAKPKDHMWEEFGVTV